MEDTTKRTNRMKNRVSKRTASPNQRRRASETWRELLSLLILLVLIAVVTQDAVGDPWGEGWLYRKAITIDHTMVAGDLTNFPVLVSLDTDADLAAKAQADGDDIVFTDASGNRLSHEIEYYDSTTGELDAWVNVSSLSSSGPTALYLYYGNAAASNQQDPENVWDSNFVMVQHLTDETPSTTSDSTANNNDGTKKGPDEPVETVEGQNFDGADDYIGVLNNAGLHYGAGDEFTYTAWIKSELLDRYKAIFTHRSPGRRDATIGLWTSNSDLYIEVKNDGRTSQTSGTAGAVLSPDTWHYVGLTRSASGDVTIWLDSIPYSKGTCIGPLTPSQDLHVGVHFNSTLQQFFDGTIDEFRVSRSARSAEWIATSYNNQGAPDLFYSVGSEELGQLPEQPVLSNESPADGAVDVALNPVLSIDALDHQGDSMDIIFMTNASGSWEQIGTTQSGGNGTYTQATTVFDAHSTVYSWRVDATDPCGSGNWTSEVYSFTTVPPAPQDPPELSNESPADTAADVPLNPTLSITVVDSQGDTVDVRFLTDVSGSWQQIGTTQSGGNGTYTQPTTVFDGYSTQYSWRVEATDPAGSGTWTIQTYSFTTEAEPVQDPPVLSNETPADGAAGVTLNPTLSINVVDNEGDAVDVRFMTDVSGSWQQIGTTQSGGNGTYTQLTTVFDSFSTQYSWRAEASDPAGSGQWTVQTYSFTTAAEPVQDPPVLSNESPADTATDVPLNPTLSVTVIDNEGDAVDVKFLTNASGSWQQIGTTQSGGNGTYTQPATVFDSYSTQYSWRVEATDPAGSGEVTTQTYSLTTKANSPPVVSSEIPADGSATVSASLFQLSFTLTDSDNELMDYTVTTTPDITGGPQSGSNVSSGTLIQVPITAGPLDYSTLYTWTVDVNDGQGQISRTLSFTTQSEPGGWWNSSWLFRKEIIIDSTLVDGPLSSFPVLVSIDSDADLGANAQSDGDDITFTDASGTKLDHEIEFFDYRVGELVAWVRANSLSDTTDTKLYVYYGNATADNQEDLNGVWDSDHKIVQHFAHNWIPYPETGASVTDLGTFASVIKVEDTYYMYYTRSSYTYLATSSDAVTWTIYPTNPVLRPTETWENKTGVPWAWKEGDTWYMLYRGGNPPVGGDAMGLATSSDGINWVKHPANPVLMGEIGQWDEVGAENWGTIKVDDTYYAYYECIYDGVRHIGVATSTDLVNWTKDPANPIFGEGRFCPCVFKYGDYFYMLTPRYMAGADYARIELYRDTAPTFHPGSREYLGPVKPCSYTGFDTTDQDTPCILADSINVASYNLTNQELWMYHDGATSSRAVGLTISPSIPQAIKGVMRDSTSFVNHGDGAGLGGPVQGFTKIGGGYTFAGSSDYVFVTDSPSLDISGAITMEAWVKLDTQLSSQTNANPAILAKTDGNAGYGMWLNRAGENLIVSVGDTDISIAVDGYDWTTWHSIVVSYDGGTLRIYIDGSLESSQSLAGPIGLNNEDLWIGDLVQNSGNTLFGAIDEVRISGAARSSAWISTSYNNQNAPDQFHSVGVEEIGNLPEEPELLNESPANGTVDVQLNPTLSIDAIDHQGNAMEIMFLTNASGSWQQIGSTQTGGNGTYTQPTTVFNDYSTVYSWRVDAIDPAGSGNWTSEVYSFTTIAPPPQDPPILSNESPADAATDVPLNPTLSIDVVDDQGDAVQVRFLTNASGSWQQIGTTQSGGNGTYTQPTTVFDSYSTAYSWRAEATDPAGTGTWTSQTYSFTTKANSAPVISNEFPADGSFGVPISLTELSFTLTDADSDLMDYTVTISPDITGGPQSGTNISSGTTIQIPITAGPLEYGAEYTWTVDVNDGFNPTTSVLTFTAQPAPGSWWNDNWPYRKEITIDHTKVAGNLANFPVLISIDLDADLAANAQADGDDIVFTDFSATALDHEIEYFDPATGKLVAWVRVGTLPWSVDTTLYMYYGNATATAQQNPESVWDSSFVMVQHMTDTTAATISDSTANNNDGTKLAADEPVETIDGQHFDGDDDYISVTNNPGLYYDDGDEFTYTAWVKSDQFDRYKAIVTHRGRGSRSPVIGLWMAQDDLYYEVRNDGRTSITYGRVGLTLSIDTWYHVAMTRSASGDITVWLDASPYSVGVSSGSITPAQDLYIGLHRNGNRYIDSFDGIIDEVRLSSTERSAEWISTSHNNQRDPAAFYSVGGQVSR